MEVFTAVLEAKVLIKQWRWEYNQVRPHSSLGYRPPAPEAILLTMLTTSQVVSLSGAGQHSRRNFRRWCVTTDLWSDL